jgi:hypothetical protein
MSSCADNPNTFRGSKLAKKYRYQDLNWFYRQWVTETYLPSYELTYHIEPDPGERARGQSGGVFLKGEVLQKGLPERET